MWGCGVDWGEIGGLDAAREQAKFWSRILGGGKVDFLGWVEKKELD